MKILKYDGTGSIKKSNDFTLLVVRFKDLKGNTYEWAPKWKDIEDIFKHTYATEEKNNGGDCSAIIGAAMQVLVWYTNNIMCQGVKLKPGGNRKLASLNK